jgi:hypothetical protein
MNKEEWMAYFFAGLTEILPDKYHAAIIEK